LPIGQPDQRVALTRSRNAFSQVVNPVHQQQHEARQLNRVEPHLRSDIALGNRFHALAKQAPLLLGEGDSIG
jgi:hypothetical protein